MAKVATSRPTHPAMAGLGTPPEMAVVTPMTGFPSRR